MKKRQGRQPDIIGAIRQQRRSTTRAVEQIRPRQNNTARNGSGAGTEDDQGLAVERAFVFGIRFRRDTGVGCDFIQRGRGRLEPIGVLAVLVIEDKEFAACLCGLAAPILRRQAAIQGHENKSRAPSGKKQGHIRDGIVTEYADDVAALEASRLKTGDCRVDDPIEFPI